MSGRSWFDATYDFLLAAAGLAVVCYPAFSTGYALVTGGPPDGQIPLLATVIVAVGGTYPFLAGDWSYRSLFRFAVVLTLYHVIGGFLAVWLVGVVSAGSPDLSTLTVRAVVLAVAYPLTAWVLVRADDWDPLGRRVTARADDEG